MSVESCHSLNDRCKDSCTTADAFFLSVIALPHSLSAFDSCPLITPVSDCLFLCLLSLSGQSLIRISVLLLLLFLDDASTNVPNCKLIYYFPLFFCLLFLFVYCSAKNRQTTTTKLVLLMPVVVPSFSPVSWCFCFY